MLLQALASYADTRLASELNDAAWEKKPVPWQLEISSQGKFLSVVPRTTTDTRGKKQVQVAMEMSVPRSPVNRNSGHHPMLGADDIAYALGAGAWTPDRPSDREKAEKHHEAFVTLIGRAAAETADAGLDACVRFYADPAEVGRAREALRDAKPGTLVALSVGGPLVDRPAVRTFWRKYYQAKFSERMEGSEGECFISGTIGAVAPTHEKIKGVSTLGGQASGVALMSFDKEAFRSYGWEQNRNSPVSPERALAYVLALNHLLKPGKVDKPTRKDIAGIGFIFWLRSPEPFDFFAFLDPPDTATVEALRGLDARADPDLNMFYLAGLSGNGGRLRVRCWVMDSLARIKLNLQEWHEQLRIAYPWDDPGPVRLWQLEYVLDREGQPPAHHTLALLRRAIEGKSQPLGYAMLWAALNRLRHPKEENTATGGKKKDMMRLSRLRVPMGLVRLCINDIQRAKGVTEMSEGLDENCAIPAYICGRLMAVFENLQRTSSEREIKSSVLDRYFALASTYPAVAFPKIESLALKHLRKLRRFNGGGAYAIDARLQDLHKKLQPTATGAYPAQLSLEGQGLFALGYYHQKAWSIAQARDRRQSKESTNENDQEKEQ
ncbi:MAG TPA: type I-C CRISPR-associated protein Cas8c/Csd1 [Acidobacteriaceae bacterium]|nr:type I-C CRISPR-associated protein Cas8c/Csd1 [Acidobacteriaceae bacterium]